MEYQQIIADIQYQQLKIRWCEKAIKYTGNVVYWQQRIKERQKIIEELKISLKSVL